MPQIIVIADGPSADGQPPVMLRERVNGSDFESQHFAAQLVERIGWAVGDAEEVDRREGCRPPGRAGFDRPREPRADAPQRELAFSGLRPAPPEW